MLKLLVVSLLVSTCVVIASADHDDQDLFQVSPGFIRLYAERDFNGEVYDDLPIDESCHPLEHPVMSAVTYGACIEFFGFKDCDGRRRTVESRDGFYFKDLTTRPWLRFGVKGYKGCAKSQNTINDEIELYDDGDGSAVEKEVVKTNGSECHHLEKVANKVSSVETHDTCVQLFQGSDCEGAWIKLFPGSGVPKALTGIKFKGSEDLVSSNTRSVKRCKVTREELVPSPTTSNIQIIPQTASQGVITEADLSAEPPCKSMRGGATGAYVRVDGLQTNGNCVQVFENEDCTGSSLKVFPGAEFAHDRLWEQTLVPNRKPADRVMSLKKCQFP